MTGRPTNPFVTVGNVSDLATGVLRVDAPVIERARQILAIHETAEHTVTEELVPKHSPMQIQLFEPVNYQIADRIRAIDVDQLRPIEALQLLAEIQKELKR